MSITTTRSVRLASAEIHVRESGPADAPPVLFLHGWPQDGSVWSRVVGLAAERHRCLVVDLPGIGRSTIDSPDGSAAHLAVLLRQTVEALGLADVALVGHDVGGMIAFAYLRAFDDVSAAVIMDTVIPGVPPWQSVIANPYLWHFAFHSIPELPERLVRHDLRAYLDFFFDAIAADPAAIDELARRRYVEAYREPSALTQGFELYRALWQQAEDNAADHSPVTTPVLYLRGEHEGGRLADYEAGLRGAGLVRLTTASVPGAGHFAPEEAPAAVWALVGPHLDAVR